MDVYRLKETPSKEVLPGFSGKFIHTPNMTFAYWDIKKGSRLPEHQHPHEQVVNLLDGEFELHINGDGQILTPGSIVVIPGDCKHSGQALTACRILDVFSPVRDDYK